MGSQWPTDLRTHLQQSHVVWVHVVDVHPDAITFYTKLQHCLKGFYTPYGVPSNPAGPQCCPEA
jgi:hypothetical protein